VAFGWGHLLTDGDDPEHRIADLERQLAERQLGAGLPPVRADAAAASRRFVACGAVLTFTRTRHG
jgi:hypothetical protein